MTTSRTTCLLVAAGTACAIIADVPQMQAKEACFLVTHRFAPQSASVSEKTWSSSQYVRVADDYCNTRCDQQVVQELLADPNSPWHEYRGRGPITKNQVAALLRDYDIRPVVVHPTKRADFSRHGYRAAQFEDAFARFLPHEPNIRTLKRGREGM